MACARKSSTPASAAIAAAVSGLSPVIMTVRMPMMRIWAKRSRMPPLTMSFRWITPSTRGPSATTSGVPPVREIRRQYPTTVCGKCPPRSMTCCLTDSVAPLRIARPSIVQAAHARLRGERDELGLVLGDLAAAQAVFLLRQHHDAAAFGRFVGKAGKLRGIGQFGFATRRRPG